jgi:D-aspartate ligase
LGIPVHLLDTNPRAPSFRSRYSSSSFVWDLDSNSQERSVEYLGEIASRWRRPAVLVPTSDAGELFVAANAAALSQWFLFPRLPYEVVRRLVNKKEMNFLAQSVGISTPESFFPESRQSAMAFARNAEYPLILKKINGSVAPSKSSHMNVVARTEQELLAAYDLMNIQEYPNLMIQEYIPEGTGGSWMFNGYFNSESKCLFGSSGKKIRQNPPNAGITSLGVCLPNQEIIDKTQRFIDAIGYAGIVDIDYIFDRRDGLYKMLDVNPRIGCTFRLFVSATGMDVVRALYFDLTGQAVAAGRCLDNRKWIVEPSDFASSFRSWRRGGLKFTEWMRSFRGLKEAAYFAVDDPYPVIAMCGNYLRGRSLAPVEAQTKRPAFK